MIIRGYKDDNYNYDFYANFKRIQIMKGLQEKIFRIGA